MYPLKAIIFDVDGTLANTEETHRQSFNSAFEEFGLGYHWSEQEYAGLLSISGGRERITAYLKARKFKNNGEFDLRDFALHLHQRKSQIYRENLIAGHVGLRNGVLRLIAEAKQKRIKLGIATATSMANVETLLQQNIGKEGLAQFDVVVTSDIIKDKKPSPAVYQFATAELGLTPETCIAIEDTTNGNRAARAAGLKTVITTHAFTIDNDFSGASLVINQLGEPDKPFSVISGNSFGASYVDTGLLKSLLNEQEMKSIDRWPDNVVRIAK
jgi:HAD superfamily hydrolase (TIGR01509 family)